jgi:hypothetical protein
MKPPRLVWKSAGHAQHSRVHIVAMRYTGPTIYFSYCGKRFYPVEKGFGVGGTVGLNTLCQVCSLRHSNEVKRIKEEERLAKYQRLHPE